MGDRQLTLERAPVPAEEAAELASYVGGVGLDALPGRDLSPVELEELVAAVVRDPARWRDRVAFDADERVYVSLHRDAHVDVWLLCWTPENDTGWHDHDVSSGAVAVVEGELVENNLTLRRGSRETSVRAGTVFSFGGDHIHRLTGSAPRSVSVHAYSPPLWRMGQYAVNDAGVLRRVSLSYADELRPID
jgi:hypothetical protein